MTARIHGRIRCRACGELTSWPDVVREDADGTWIRCRECGAVVLRMTPAEVEACGRVREAERQQAYSMEHRAQIKRKNAAYYQAHKEQHNAYMREYYRAHSAQLNLMAQKRKLAAMRAEKG